MRNLPTAVLPAFHRSAPRRRARFLALHPWPLEDLEANPATDHERFAGMASPGLLVNDPLRAPHEAHVFREVVAELSQAVERDEVPEAALGLAPEQALA